MTGAALEASGVLAAELAANDLIDPCSVPLRFSTLKLMAQSPLHYLHGVRSGYDETLSMRLGSGADAMLFDQPYEVYPGRRAGNEWKEFQKEHTGKCILNETEAARARAMVDAIKAHPTAMRLLFSGAKFQQRIDWEWQGRKFRSTPDAAASTHLVDLKCLRSADPDKVRWQSKNMHYNAQAALYRRALNETGSNIKECFLVVVENKPPHPVTVLRFTETALEQGDRSLLGWMDQVRACEERGSYPGYVEGIVELDVPMTADELTFADDDDESEAA